MRGIHRVCFETAAEYGTPGNYSVGANIAGFLRISRAMLVFGLIYVFPPVESGFRAQRPRGGQSDGMWRSFDVGAVVESLPFSDARRRGRRRRDGEASEPGPPGRDARAPASSRRARAGRDDAQPRSWRPARTWERLVARLDAAQVAGVAVRLDPL